MINFSKGTLEVAVDLLNCSLCREMGDGSILRSRIEDTEAYDGFEDRASHAHKGLTKRTEVMFGPPGRAYIYLCYGVHWMLNVVTREEGYPAAVLIRGTEAVSGPGRLTRYFQIDQSLNGLELSRENGLWLESCDQPAQDIQTSPRMGIDYAGPEWASKPWRFRMMR